jgi:hypothetical protein
MRHRTALAEQLLHEATAGSDPPLPIALPHTRALAAMGRNAPRCDLAADEWPPGCLGYVVNLVRPVVKGHRGTVLHSQLGRGLVFETMDQAAQYRELCTQVGAARRSAGRCAAAQQGWRRRTAPVALAARRFRAAPPRPAACRAAQVLRCSLGDIYTLDRQKLSGKGVVAGSNFRVAPLEEAQYRCGRAPGGAGRRGAGPDGPVAGAGGGPPPGRRTARPAPGLPRRDQHGPEGAA